jgi:hypothetical protein
VATREIIVGIISFLNILDLPLRDEVVFMGAVVEN